MVTVKPTELAQAIELLIHSNTPPMIWSAPGMGKSQIVAQTANRMGRALLDVRAVLLDPVDLRGLPHLNGDNRAHWAIPDFLPRAGSGPGILFLDELNRAPMLVQNACLQLVLDRCIGEYRLPDDWCIVAAGNDRDAGCTRFSEAIRTRFVHLYLAQDVEQWCKWAIAHLTPEVVAFIRFRPEMLTDVAPRIWEFISRITVQHPSAAIEHALFAGAAGESAAIEYSGFLRLYRELPSRDAILLAPATAPVPTSPASLYAISSALAHCASPTNFGRILTYLARLPVEYSVLAVRDSIMHDATLQATADFTQWAIAHSDVIL